MSNPNEIRTRTDGSIDTAYYTERARYLRSRQAHDIMGTTKPSPKKPGLITRLFTL